MILRVNFSKHGLFNTLLVIPFAMVVPLSMLIRQAS